MNNEKWLIRGGWSAHGRLKLSGDTYHTIASLSYLLLQDGSHILTNVPRSNIVLEFMDQLKKCGFNVEWIGIDSIKCSVNWNSYDTDLSKQTSLIPHYFEIIINIILARSKVCVVPLKYRKLLSRHKRLGFDIELFKDVGFCIRSPRNYPTQKIHIKSIERDFYTVLNYAILKYTYPEIFISLKSAFDPVGIFSNEHDILSKSLSVPISRKEFHFYSSLAILTEGELLIENVDLSSVLGFLLHIYEIGASYEVSGDTVKIWQDFKELKQYYNLTKLEADELGYILLYLSLFSTKRLLVKVQKSDINLLVVKNLNIMGCSLNYTDFETQSIMLEIRPSNLKSFKQQITELQFGGVLLAGSFSYDGNTIVSDLNHLSDYFEYLKENLIDLGLKFVVR